MPPSKYTNAQDQMRAERRRFEAKQRPKPILADKIKMKIDKRHKGIPFVS